jgi:hypothetical protein
MPPGDMLPANTIQGYQFDPLPLAGRVLNAASLGFEKWHQGKCDRE